MPRRFAVLALCAALAWAALPARGAGSAEEPVSPIDVHALVSRVLEAYGGRVALSKVGAYRMEGVLFSLQRHDESPTVRVFARPARLKILIGYDKSSEVRLVDGAKGWRKVSGGTLESASGPMLDAMVLQAARADVPWILAERESSARLVEPLERGDERLPGIEIPLENGLRLRAYVHPRTHRVEVSQGLLDHGGMSTHFETVYSDFRKVDGLWFAHREENWASGTQTGITTIRRILLDPKLAPGEFAPPTLPKSPRSGS